MALAAGLTLGAAMKPDLGLDERLAGPQIVDDGPRLHPTGPFDDGASYAAYKGRLPDYVLGTDWKKLTSPAARPEPRAAGVTVVEGAPLRSEAFTPAIYGDAPPPSFDADQAYDDASRAERTPLAWAVDVEDEAPPEAAGDTRAR